MAGLSHFRFATGVCVLTAGLLIGGVGGAVAVADPDSSGSAAHGKGGNNASGQHGNGNNGSGHGNAGNNASGQQGNGNNGGGHGNAGNDASGQQGNGNNASGEQHGNGGNTASGQPSTGAESPKDEPGGTDSTDETNDSGLGAAAPDQVAPVPAAVAPIPNLVAPVSDGITGVEPVVDAWGRIDSAAPSAAVNAWVASELPQLWAFAGIPGMPVADIATGVAPLGGIAASIFAAMTQVGGASSLPGLAQSFFRPASSELLLTGTGSLSGLAAPSGVAGLMILNAAGVLPISLAALAALALPGAGGLTFLTAAGVRVGYRQAKAGSALRTAGIARFAGPGPLGVVRSGSLVVIRPRTGARRRALSAGDPFQKVA
jgi:hypothetical protein